MIWKLKKENCINYIYNYYLRKADNLYLKVSKEVDETMVSGR